MSMNSGRVVYVGGIGVGLAAFFTITYFLIRPHLPTSNANTSTLVFPQNLASSSGPFAFAGEPPDVRIIPARTKEYRNTRYGFSLFYPDNLNVSIFDEGGGASTVTFQNILEVKGFQIFIVPYQGEQVSTARFHADEPSGVLKQPMNILVGGTKATMFFSTSATLGDTIEVWLIKGGFLFEITAPKQLDVWLAHIMQTWEFL